MFTIATFSQPEQAHLLRGRLEASGIPAYLRDEHTIQLDWLYSDALGGVRVVISEHHLQDALALLELPPEESFESSMGPCPQCNSKNVVAFETPKRLFLATLLIIKLPIFYTSAQCKCQDCGSTWR